MPGYTTKGLDNLLDRIMEKIDNIISQLIDMDESSEQYYILLENHDQYIIDYSNILQLKMDLGNKIMTNESTVQT